VLNPVLLAREMGSDLTLLRPTPSGAFDPDDLRAAIRKNTIMVSIMHANNETGIIQPVQEAGRILREMEIVFHVDAAQSVGKIPVDVQSIGADLLTLAGHKFHASKGSGVLYVRRGIRLTPLMRGASHEGGLRPGTECTPLIAGLGKAAEILIREGEAIRTRVEKITGTLLELLRYELDDIFLTGDGKRLPNTLGMMIKGIEGSKLVQMLADEVALSVGSACHEGSLSPSHVLTAMGINARDAISMVRISTGRGNTEEEIHKAAELITEAVRRLRDNRSR